MHATVEGRNSWIIGYKLISPWITTLDFKDFIWNKNEEGKWKMQLMHLGEGMVDYDLYFEELKQLRGNAPVSIHYEYDLGGAEHGSKDPSMDVNLIYKKLQKDLDFLKSRI